MNRLPRERQHRGVWSRSEQGKASIRFETMFGAENLSAAGSEALGRVSGALSRHVGQLGPALGQPESNEGQESGMPRQHGRARDNRNDVGDNCPMPSDNADACRGNWDEPGDNCPQSGDNGDRLRDNRSMSASTGIDLGTIGTGLGTTVP